jgi:ABC-2 type transport system permease protein
VSSARSAAAPVSAEPGQGVKPSSPIVGYVRAAVVVGETELRKIRHDPTDIFTRAVQPLLWLVIFGEAFARLHALPTGKYSYLAFLTPGVLSQSVMFISIFYGLTLIWERDAGIIQKFLVLPVPRGSYVAGRAVGAGTRALAQGVVVLCLALILGVKLHWSVGGIIGSLFAILLGAGFFSTLSMLIAVLVKSRDRFMGVGQVITMPLFFASNAIYPIDIMPHWLMWVARFNPLTYVVDLLRGFLVTGTVPHAALDFVILAAALTAAQILAARSYARVVV